MVWGIGWPDVVADRALIRDDPEALLAYREAMKHQGERRDIGNNITEVDSSSATGTSRAYSLARVQRECDAETARGRWCRWGYTTFPIPG